MKKNTQNTTTTNNGNKVGASSFGCLSEVVNKLFNCTVYTGKEYSEKILKDIPRTAEGKIDISELSLSEILKYFGNADMIEKFEKSAYSVVLISDNKVVFLLDNKKKELKLLMEWLSNSAPFERLSEIVGEMFDCKPFTGKDYSEKYLKDVPHTEEGKIDINELSLAEIFNYFGGDTELIEKFEDYPHSVVIVSDNNVEFLLDCVKTENELLIEWLSQPTSLVA